MNLAEQVADLETQNAALKTANARLQARLIELESIIGIPRDKFHSLRLTGMQKKMLPLLMQHEVVTREMFYQFMYGDGGHTPPSEKTIEVHVCKLRKKLPEGVKVCSEYGNGWYIPDEGKAILSGRQQ